MAHENVGPFEELVEPNAEEPRRSRVCERTAIGRACANEESFFLSTHRNVSRAIEEARSDLEVHRNVDGRTRARASQEGRCGICRWEIPRAASRVAVGRQGFAGGKGVVHEGGRPRSRKTSDSEKH